MPPHESNAGQDVTGLVVALDVLGRTIASNQAVMGAQQARIEELERQAAERQGIAGG